MIVIYPTETCYGIGCEISDVKSIKRIFESKGRAPEKGLIVVVPDIGSWKEITVPNNVALALAEHFWPGPLTLICIARKNVPKEICQNIGTDFTIACRQSSNEIASALSKEYGPIISTSANMSEGKNPYSIDEVPQGLKNIAEMTIDGGKLPKKKPSTIYDCVNMKMIRQGEISEGRINEVIKKIL
jgi:L-threonylcarbamoyladenylate synthase